MLKERSDYVETVSESDIKCLLSEYFHSCEFEQSSVGFSNLEEPWKKEPILVDCGEVLFRVLDAIENCVVLFSSECSEDKEILNDSQGFGGVFIGSFMTRNDGMKTHSFKLEVFGELIVLYSTAILISRYEKEVSRRVLHECSDSVVEAVNRKLKKQQTYFGKQISPNVSNTVVSINEDGCKVVNVDFTDSYSPLR